MRNKDLRPEGSVARECDAAYADVATGNDGEALMARGSYESATLPDSVEPVPRRAPSCDLMEGGLGI